MTFRVGITGHRTDRLTPTATASLSEGIRDVLQEVTNSVQSAHQAYTAWFASGPPDLRFVSPLADGADQVGAQAASRLGYSIDAPMPFTLEQARRDQPAGIDLEPLNNLASNARLFELDMTHAAGSDAYEAASLVTLHQSDLLIAVWDGRSGQGRGGTEHTVRQAFLAGIPVIRFDEAGGGPWLIRPQSSRQLDDDTFAVQLPLVEGDIAGLVDSLLQPPNLVSSGAATHNRELERYLGERWRPRNLWFAYPMMAAALTGGTRLTTSFARSTPPHDAGTAITAPFWKPMTEPQPGDAQFPDLSAQALLIETRFAWADHLALHLGQVYRSSYISVFACGALAVFFALLSVILPVKPVSTMLELAAIMGAVGVVIIGERRHWHRRWMEYRLLAEQLRSLRLLTPLGATPAIRQRPPGKDRVDPAINWIEWYVTATARELRLPSGRASAAYLQSVTKAVQVEVDGQRSFHELNAARQLAIEHGLDRIGQRLFAGAAGLLCVFLFYELLAGSDHGEGSAGGITEAISKLVTFLSALLPTLGSALFAIRAQGDFDESARLSQDMLTRLNPVSHAIATKTDPGFSWLSNLVESTVDALFADLSGWRIIYRGKPLTLPG